MSKQDKLGALLISVPLPCRNRWRDNQEDQDTEGTWATSGADVLSRIKKEFLPDEGNRTLTSINLFVQIERNKGR